MFLKPRDVPLELQMLRYLNVRMRLPPKDKQHYHNLEKGYEGEVIFDSRLVDLTSECLILPDLLLEQNRNIFQIDTSIIFQENIHLFEIKNFEGDFDIQADEWSTISGEIIKNPLHQLKRNESLLKQLLYKNLKIPFPVQPHLVFVNPHFTLYNASPEMPIIFPSQIDRFIKKLNGHFSKVTQKNHQLGKQLATRHRTDSPFTRMPPYNYAQLQKGIVCAHCASWMIAGDRKMRCNRCGRIEDNETAIMRHVAEFKTLFPEHKITTNTIRDWCGNTVSAKKVQRVLAKNFTRINHGKISSYID
ncbi:nuclease-related domain-containing protein [Natribacillus halophilus]|uniref:Nuclease-related domain-containing protein n=1 Tax=Natribacillus halophilus TaxID=549003 RepID=A0A1G8KTM9_9BACI|nr:nuclease-related domain-containing protein [Natribacillus halophilus]SDI46737.1 Nuclease-related domain-containing protein [Natribacillus halophilus]